MGLPETTKLLHSKGDCHQIEEAAHRMLENLYQLYIWQGINHQNLQGAQKTDLPKNQWPNDEMGKWTEQKFLKRRCIND
jgi:hypothetical protein